MNPYFSSYSAYYNYPDPSPSVRSNDFGGSDGNNDHGSGGHVDANVHGGMQAATFEFPRDRNAFSAFLGSIESTSVGSYSGYGGGGGGCQPSGRWTTAAETQEKRYGNFADNGWNDNSPNHSGLGQTINVAQDERSRIFADINGSHKYHGPAGHGPTVGSSNAQVEQYSRILADNGGFHYDSYHGPVGNCPTVGGGTCHRSRNFIPEHSGSFAQHGGSHSFPNTIRGEPHGRAGWNRTRQYGQPFRPVMNQNPNTSSCCDHAGGGSNFHDKSCRSSVNPEWAQNYHPLPSQLAVNPNSVPQTVGCGGGCSAWAAGLGTGNIQEEIPWGRSKDSAGSAKERLETRRAAREEEKMHREAAAAMRKLEREHKKKGRYGEGVWGGFVNMLAMWGGKREVDVWEKEKQRRVKKAMKEQESLNRKAEKVRRWMSRVSSQNLG